MSRQQFHVVSMHQRHVTHLKCQRCNRDMPIEYFAPLRRQTLMQVLGAKSHGGRYVQFYGPNCMTCRKQSTGAHVKHRLYTPALDRYWAKRLRSIAGGAQTREIMCLLSKDDLLGLYLEQQGLCAMTGVEMTCNIASAPRMELQASVDRIDSNGNYTLDNIQIVCAVVNVMKTVLPQSRFVDWCRKVVDYADKQEAQWSALINTA